MLAGLNLKGSSEARFWYFNLGALLVAMLLGTVIGARLEPFLWLLVCRPLAAMAITLLPPTTAGDHRPYMLGATLLCLLLAQLVDPRGSIFCAAAVALFCLLDPSLDALLAETNPEVEWLGRMAQLVLVRSCGLGLGLIVGSLQWDWGLAIVSASLLTLALLLALVPERPDRTALIPRREGTEVRLATLVDSLAQMRDRQLAGDLLVLFSIAYLAGSFGALAYPAPMLSVAALNEWLSRPGQWLLGGLLSTFLALILERLSRQTLIALCYSAVLLLSAAHLAAPERAGLAATLIVACGLSLLVAFRQLLARQIAIAPALRVALPSTVWALGMLGGQLVLSKQALLGTRATASLVIALGLLTTWRTWEVHGGIKASVLDTESDRRARGQGRHGDKTLDFTAAPQAPTKRRSRWLARLWYFLSIRFPVTITLAVLASLTLAGTWHAWDERKSFEQQTRGMWITVKTQLFLTSLQRRTEEEMLASNRVPTDWADFIAKSFELDGRPLKDQDFWGTPLHFDSLPGEVMIVSAGPDKKLFTPDDLMRLAKKPHGVR